MLFVHFLNFTAYNPLNTAICAIHTVCKVKRKKIDFGAVAGSLFYQLNSSIKKYPSSNFVFLAKVVYKFTREEIFGSDEIFDCVAAATFFSIFVCL